MLSLFSQILFLTNVGDKINVKTTDGHVKIIIKLMAAINYFLIETFIHLFVSLTSMDFIIFSFQFQPYRMLVVTEFYS